MRKYTKCLMTLGLLLVAGVASAKETVVFSMDYSTQSSYPFWGDAPEGSSFTLDGGMLVIDNTKEQANAWDLQIDLAEGFSATAGLDYRVNIVYKTTANGNINLGMGTLTGDIQYEDRVNWYGASVTANDDFQTFTWNISPYTNTNAANHVIWQCGKLIATVYIKSIEVIEIIPDEPKPTVIYGDLKAVTPTMYVKNYGDSEESVATADVDGVYSVTDAVADADTWATQFWIAGEYALPAGQKFKVEFDYMATDAQTVPTQTHAAPSSYIYWACIGDVSFTKDWEHFEQEVTLSSEMGGWKSIAFNMHRGTKIGDSGDVYTGSNTTYYIKNVSLKEAEVLGEAVSFSVGSIGWASFSSDKDVALGTAKGYAAKFNGTTVDLVPVTEVPTDNAVLIEGAGKYTFNVIASAAAIADNDLLISDGTVVGDGTIYVLANGANGVGFYKLEDAAKVPASKAYLKLAAPAPEFLGFSDGNTTSINELNVKGQAEGTYFNLAGQRVAQPTKGLYIVNGKKVVIK